jgi:tRNA dimethylallyltransferase
VRGAAVGNKAQPDFNVPLNKILAIVGPTAVGKTSAAIEAALHLQTQIISADSRQCYKELNIGVARPSEQQLASVPHHFIASHSIHHPLNAADFETQALEVAERIFKEHEYAVLAGGTGLYIKAFLEGLDEIPQVDTATRQEIVLEYEEKGLSWLQDQLRMEDPWFFAEGEIKNPHRLMRALEVVRATGHSILSFRKKEKKPRSFVARKIGLDLPKEQLLQHISNRTEQMLAEGLVDEVRCLMEFRHYVPLQTVGYTEVFEYLDGKISMDEAVSQIVTHTWQYAKRQLTWFRRDRETEWMSPREFKDRISQLLE